jgi:hypothetical protein
MAAGSLRLIAASLLPWVQQRQTFGAPIGSRELVQRRLGGRAARIVACDALTAWTAQLLDQGYRGELECVTAKVFGSEAVKEATVDVLLKTHGGRALLAGNLFTEALWDLLAPTVYEGENEILTLGYFRTLARRAQLATVMLVVSRYADRQSDPWVRQAGVCAALELGARLTGAPPTGEIYHWVTELGRAVAEEQFPVGRDAERGAVVMAEPLTGGNACAETSSGPEA